MFPDLIKAVILGVVEGITEFLPVSSTGHLILAGNMLDFDSGAGAVFDIFIQLGAILAVAVLFRGRIAASLRDFSSSGWRLWAGLAIAFLPSAAAGFLFHDAIEARLFNPFCVAVALFVGGVLMLVIERRFGSGPVRDVGEVGFGVAFKVGLAQCLALVPGMSRSACTMMGGMLAGLSVPVAAEFSFLLAIPTMVAASGYALLKNLSSLTPQTALLLAVGFVVSFAVAFLVVDGFLRYLRTRGLAPFAWYRIALAAVVLFLVA